MRINGSRAGIAMARWVPSCSPPSAAAMAVVNIGGLNRQYIWCVVVQSKAFTSTFSIGLEAIHYEFDEALQFRRRLPITYVNKMH